MDNTQVKVQIERLKNFEFKVKFLEEDIDLLMDEPEPLGSNNGPNAVKVLSAAIGNCLTASLLFCLNKSHIEPANLVTTVSTSTSRNEKGRLRVSDSRVEITMGVEKELQKRMRRCLELFEDFCVVSQSISNGININSVVKLTDGGVIYDSTDNENK
ncbi:MAG: OsmC family protein [candidate division Zixibacteria bacterium]|nr:OsmC family protein [candidate division Zixibacteria bacterium]